jgi:hypothetical protein
VPVPAVTFDGYPGMVQRIEHGISSTRRVRRERAMTDRRMRADGPGSPRRGGFRRCGRLDRCTPHLRRGSGYHPPLRTIQS